MAMTDDVVKKARELGALISQHEATRKYRAALEKLRQDQEAQRLLNDLNRKLEEIEQKEQSGRPIEVGDKRTAESLRGQVARHPLLCELQVAQLDYVDLMRKVDGVLSSEAGGGGR
jgi:cell fate (sporulation/competence/biofilm development) regulator YlbF (YheA/YmcA/DUF963 family)